MKPATGNRNYDFHYEISSATSFVRKEKFVQNRHKTLFVTSEFSGLIKTGGLGDVAAALPEALSHQHDIRVLIPGYRQVINSGYPMEIIGKVNAFASLPSAHIGRIKLRTGLLVYVVLCPELYDREGNPYSDAQGKDWDDNPIRFARLSLAAAEMAAGTCDPLWQPDLVHANDWPTALVPAYMQWRGQKTPSVFTIHNLAHHGIYSWDQSIDLGFPLEAFSIDGMEFHGKFSLLKAGIVYATKVTTVSRTYAREITTPEFGSGLHGLLEQKYQQDKLIGIINGVESSWKPELGDVGCGDIKVQDFPHRKWAAKKACVRHVEKMFGLPKSDAPIFAVISRLVHQKGLDLTIAAAESIVANGARLVVMGCGEPAIEQALQELAQRHPKQVGVHIGFNEAESRQIFAGSDFLLMPSRFEPCGLSQLYAQLLGSLPIAHRTGGLADTVEDGVTGFLFRECNLENYLDAINRALAIFRCPDLLNAMRYRAMLSPLTWQEAARPYQQLYEQLITEYKGSMKTHKGELTS